MSGLKGLEEELGDPTTACRRVRRRDTERSPTLMMRKKSLG